MDLIQESFQRLFPEKEFSYSTELNYNRRLNDFNANISLRQRMISVNMNLQWKDIAEEIKIGLIQSLLLKIFRERKDTPNLQLYNHFVKNISVVIPKTEDDFVLNQSFQRVNAAFFQGALEKPNLLWGQAAFRKLASYNFHNDSITVSSIFTHSRPEVLDFLMYHELLHKSHKFQWKEGRSRFHTKQFREAEQQYPEHEQIEAEINQVIRSQRKKKSFWSFF